MADTWQIVQWTLEQACALRQEEALRDPGEAHSATARARILKKSNPAGFGAYGDVCVTSYTFAETPKRLKRGVSWRYPSSGFIVSQVFANVGGAEGLKEMCGRCPANAAPDAPARCAGSVYQRPESRETQEQLERIISRLGLEVAMSEVFPRTEPLWYGFWTASRLNDRALELLHVILEAMLAEDQAEEDEKESRGANDRHCRELELFLAAIQTAQRYGLNLHVSMAPPGHTDFGIYTVFPHCPFCKAGTKVKRWQRQYPTQLYPCHVCGTEYSPAESATDEEMDDERIELRDVLGKEAFREFAADYLVEQGLDAKDAAEIVELTEIRAAERQAKMAADCRRAEREQAYVANVLFAGLHPVHEQDDGERTGNLLRKDEFLELLNRCAAKEVVIRFMYHVSQREEMERGTWRGVTRPLEVFQQWVGEGCNELFGATFHVPGSELGAIPNDDSLSG